MSGSPQVFPAALVLFTGATLAFAQKMPNVRLDVGSPPGAASSDYPKIASAGSSVYVTWQDGRNGASDVYFNRSLDGGATWLASDVRLDVGSAPGASSANYPEVAASGSEVYVVWRDDRNSISPNSGTDIYFNRSLDGGATWLVNDVQLDVGTSPSAFSLSPRIAVSGSSVFVVWDESGKVYFNRSLDAGTSWLASSVRLDSLGGEDPEIAASDSGVYVVWTRSTLLGDDIYFDRSLDVGATWLPSEVRLSIGRPPSSSGAGQPQIASWDSAVYVTWWDTRNGEPDVYFNRSLDGGTTWLDPDTRLDVGSPPGAAASGLGFVFPALGIAASGASVHVAWADLRHGTQESVYFNRSLDSGMSWLDPDVRLDTGSLQGYSRYPRIAAAGASIYVVWREEHLGAGSDVEFQRSIDAGASWLATQATLDPGASSIAFPEIAASGASAYAAWDDYRNGESDVYLGLALGFQPYGQGTKGLGGIVPTIAGSGTPSIGGTFSIDIASCAGGASGFLLSGMNGPASIAIDAGRLYVQPPLQSISFQLGGSKGSPGVGSASVEFRVPNDPVLIGTRLNFQARILDPQSRSHLARTDRNVTLTGGLEAWIL